MPAPGARSAAKEAGLFTYFTGVPCANGHLTERYAKNGGCIGCRIMKQGAIGWKEKHRVATKKSYQKHRSRILVRQKKYIAENPEIIRETKLKCRLKNPEKHHAHTLNRRARLASIGVSSSGKIGAVDMKNIISRQKGRCAACGEKAKLDMDHIMPLALGGCGDRSNLQGLCPTCNRRKHAKHPIDFNRSLGLLL